MKKKIAIVDNSIGTTGAFLSIFNYVQYSSDRFNYTFFIPKDSTVNGRLEKGEIRYHRLPFLEISKSLYSLIRYPFVLFKNAQSFKRLTSSEEIDLVHINDFYNLVPILSKALGAKYKLITHVRFMPDRFPSLLQKIWINLHLRYSEKIICVSNAVQKQLPKHDKIIRIYDHLPTKIGADQAKPTNTKIKLLYLAHYMVGKGQDYAIKAFHKAYIEFKNMELKFVGGDMGLEKNSNFKKQLIQEVKNRGLEKAVSFHEETEDTQGEMRKADIFLNFSESESFSMTTLEALNLGVPVIVSNSGGPAELFENERSGLLVENRNIDKMAKAIVQLATNDSLKASFSKNGTKYVQQKFSLKNSFDELIKLYNKSFEHENL